MGNYWKQHNNKITKRSAEEIEIRIKKRKKAIDDTTTQINYDIFFCYNENIKNRDKIPRKFLREWNKPNTQIKTIIYKKYRKLNMGNANYLQ